MKTLRSMLRCSFTTLAAFAVCACTTPRQQAPQPSPQQSTGGLRAAQPASAPATQPTPVVVVPKDHFTIGSTMDEVAAIMGTPSKVMNFLDDKWWYYELSRVVFRGGRVSEWDNTSDNLKVRWSATSAPPQTRSARSYPAPGVSASVPSSAPAVRRALPRIGGGGGIYVAAGKGHWIQSNSDNGGIITLEDGSVWQVDAIDRIDTALWLPITEITVAESGGGYLLINTDDGEKAHATLLKQ